MANGVAADAARGAGVSDARCAGLGNVDDIARGLRIGLSHDVRSFVGVARCGQTVLGVSAPWAVAFCASDTPAIGGGRPEARRYSFALSILSRTQGAPPRRLSLSRWGGVSLMVTGTVTEPSAIGLRPLPGLAPPRVLFSSMRQMVNLFT